MNAQRHTIPAYVDGLVDFEALRRLADAHAFCGIKPASKARRQARQILIVVAALAFAASVVVAAALTYAPADRTDAKISHDGDTFGDRIKRNGEALRRSRAWWESYGQGAPPSTREP